MVFLHIDTKNYNVKDNGETPIQTLNKFITSGKNVFALIYMEGCGPCNATRPEWQKLKHVQQTFDVLIIMDDIFMGGGKTGDYFGWKHLPIQPDICTMGKAITGGYFPLSITMYNEKIHQTLPTNFDWDHGYTYNFSLSGINSALKYMDILEKEQVLNNHQTIQNTAVKTIQSTGFKILNRFGCLYMIRKGNYKNLYIVPLNATEEYFTVLKQNLESYENN